MLHALTAPLGKAIAVGGLAVLALAVARPHDERTDGRRLVLHAQARPTAHYLTRFENDELRTRDAGPLATIVFRNHGNVGPACAPVTEGPACHWLATERLEPIDEHTYAYSYTEELLGCDDGAVQNCIDTPRTGYVTVER